MNTKELIKKYESKKQYVLADMLINKSDLNIELIKVYDEVLNDLYENNMSTDYIKREQTVCNFVCGRYYLVEYKHCDCVLGVKGLLENYFGGNVVILAKDGIYHIKYKDIVHMRPVKMPSLDKFNESYQVLLKALQEDDVRY